MKGKQVLIVGGGIAGLTAGVYAAKAGHIVTLLEKNGKCGGLVNSFVQEGFLFDGGTRPLEGFLFLLLKDIDIQIQYVKTPVSVGIESRFVHIESDAGIDDYRKLLESLFPESIAEIGRIFKPITKMGRFLKGVNKVLASGKGIRFFFAERIPGLFQILANIQVLLKMNTPIEHYFNKVLNIANQSLQDTILQHFFKGTPAFFALGYLYLYPDYIYALGGTGTLAAKIEERARERCVQIRTNTQVAEIKPKEKTVIDEHGTKHQYDELIWTADLKTLYRIVDEQELPEQILSAYKKEQRKIMVHKGAESIFSIFIAVNEEPDYFGRIAGCHLFYTPYRKGLGQTIRGEQTYILKNWDTLPKAEILEWLKILCKYNTFEIAIPALKDPHAAPPNKTGLIISFLFEYEIAKKARDSGWYDELKETVSKYVIGTISETLYKDLDKKILFSISSTPLSIEKISGSSEGAVIGWSMETPAPVVNTMLKMKDSVKTAIPVILKAGQWTMSPAGIPTAIMTGQLAARAIRQR